MRVVLTVAGSDTSAGAGIQQDLKTITALGQYALTVPTALTAQNTVGVRAVMPVPEVMLGEQLDAVMEDFEIDAVKIGMLPELFSARVVVERAKAVVDGGIRNAVNLRLGRGNGALWVEPQVVVQP